MNLKFLWEKYIIHIIDILLISYLLYRFILFIKGTRAIRIFIGLIILAVLSFFVVRILKLPITSWVVERFWVPGVLLLAIVFQPELRKALSEIYILRKVRISKDIAFIEEIISAVKELSEKHIGGLIVIERKIGLKDFVSTGVILNAEVSKELLLNIFYPNSPLHDGAVIISENKILSAKCILPLDESKEYNSFGTRHRAAVGITEISDAVVIVVSEETGKISLVKNKKLESGLSVEELREKINKILLER